MKPEYIENLIDALETILISGLNMDTRKKAKQALARYHCNTDRMEELNETSPN